VGHQLSQALSELDRHVRAAFSGSSGDDGLSAPVERKPGAVRIVVRRILVWLRGFFGL
jgi:hypothetical protein